MSIFFFKESEREAALDVEYLVGQLQKLEDKARKEQFRILPLPTKGIKDAKKQISLYRRMRARLRGRMDAAGEGS